MSFFTRIAIAILTGIGAGTLGFWTTWHFVMNLLNEYPAPDYDAWLVAGIFGPGVLVPLLVFHIISRPTTRQATSS